MNTMKKLLEHFSSKERKELNEDYKESLKKYGKSKARSMVFQKAYKLKTESKVENKMALEEESIPENYIDYGKYRVVWGEVKNALFCGSIKECINNKKYGYLMCKILNENEIDIYECDKVSIMGVK